jgi:hypothetical protein
MRSKDQILLENLYTSIIERAFHGTPHDIVGNFSLNKIGSGEGAQVYGWGLYFAENPKVAEQYKEDSRFFYKVNNIPVKVVHWEDIKTNNISPEEIAVKAFHSLNDHDRIYKLENDRETFPDKKKAMIAINLINQNKVKILNGNLYEVDINADKENDFINWDEPVYETDNVVKLVNKLFESKFGERNYWQGTISSGSLFYHQISKTISEKIGKIEEYGSIGTSSEQKNGSEFLKEAGVKGIKYLDQGSRDLGNGTYNYVIFDPSVIRIVSKNGEFVMQSKKPENVEI